MIIFRILQAALAASRSQLSRHIQDKPLTEKIGQLSSEAEREDLRIALVAGQESAAVQILLEACLETTEDRETPGQMWSLREIQSIICSYLHQVFIADPSLAKLVHFQVCTTKFIYFYFWIKLGINIHIRKYVLRYLKVTRIINNSSDEN